MRLIGLAVAIPFSLALATLAGEAHPNEPVRTIGILAGTPEASRVFEQGLRDLGWIEGQNVRFERHVSDDYQELLRLASELTRIPVDVIFAGNAPSIRAAMEASKTVPIISVSGDPVSAGFVASLARPGANVTRLAIMEHGAKRQAIEQS